MREWLQQHWPETLVGGLMSALAFFGVRGVGKVDKAIDGHGAKLEEHGNRLTALEKGGVTRADFDELRGSLTASITNVGMRLEARLGEQDETRSGQIKDLRDDQRVILDRLLSMKAGGA